ncbi:hypothetical protein [uncultured Pantoea sp.]|uniref:hypothetical protein n=1 Tax=uncultured Pantoea sp. TaxID=218084 RepID=UPI002583B594|nr:hypothetical protein [uncultured Pantoea sp.]
MSVGQNYGWFCINDVKFESQKITFLEQKEDYENVQIQWTAQRGDSPGWYGMDYINRNGKAILNVEAIRSNMDQSRGLGTYDCVKLK